VTVKGKYIFKASITNEEITMNADSVEVKPAGFNF